MVVPATVSTLDLLSDRPSGAVAGYLLLLAVALVAFVGGFRPALLATVLSTLSLDYFFTEPTHELLPSSSDEIAGVILFFVVAVLVSQLFERRRAFQRRAEEAAARTVRLQAVTARLAVARTPREVLDAVVVEGVEAAEARAGAIGLLSESGEEIEIVASRGYEEEVFTGWRTFSAESETPMAEVVRTGKPLFFGTSTERDDQFPTMAGLSGPSHALAVLPLIVEGQAIGGLAFTFRDEVQFDDDRRALKATLAQHASQALDRVRLYEAELALRERMTFLAHASELLGSSLDYEDTLAQLTKLAVPRMATWCSIDIVTEGGIERLAVAHEDPERVAWAERLGDEYPPDPDAPMGVPNVIRTQTAEFVPEISDELLVEAVRGDERLLEIIRELGLRSAITVPLVARGRALGALSLIREDSVPRYTQLDLELAEEIARRAATAVDNAGLYRVAERRGDAARALTHVDDGVVLVDDEGIVRFINPAAAALLAADEGAVLGHAAQNAISGWSVIEENARPLPGEARSPVTVPLAVAVAGGERWLSVSGVDFGDGTVYAVRDVSDEHALEQARSDFVATASHELRTPLAAVLGAVKTLRRGDVNIDEKQREALMNMIDEEAERLSSIVNQILLAGQLESGRVHLTPERFDPLELTRSVVDSAQLHLPDKVNIRVVAPDEMPPVAGDENQLRQVISNLVDNAIKYSPDGGDVELRLDRNSEFARIEVVDTGLGIPPDEQERIFEKFYRLDPALTRGVNGTGLGLYICKELVERMNGRISVRSESGAGSTFVVEIPLAA